MNPTPDSQPYAILIAETQAECRATFADIFGSEAFRVVFAKDGGDALEKVKAQSFDLIVTAINMPKHDGLEFLSLLRDIDQPPPVIVVGPGKNAIDAVYLRCADLLGASRTFSHPLDKAAFLREAQAIMLQNRTGSAAAI